MSFDDYLGPEQEFFLFRPDRGPDVLDRGGSRSAGGDRRQRRARPGRPACSQCGGMMQAAGWFYTCSSCSNNTGCGIALDPRGVKRIVVRHSAT
jgi:hypothetical protein